jgi:hypothetical protein
MGKGERSPRTGFDLLGHGEFTQMSLELKWVKMIGKFTQNRYDRKWVSSFMFHTLIFNRFNLRHLRMKWVEVTVTNLWL